MKIFQMLMACIVLSVSFFVGESSANEVSLLRGVIHCMRELSCESPSFDVFINKEDTGRLLRVSRDKHIQDQIILTDEWIAVRKIVQDDGESVTLVFDYDFDGKIDAVQFSHEKSPLINKRESRNMSEKERVELQNYFDLVIVMAYTIKTFSWGNQKPIPLK